MLQVGDLVSFGEVTMGKLYGVVTAVDEALSSAAVFVESVGRLYTKVPMSVMKLLKRA